MSLLWRLGVQKLLLIAIIFIAGCASQTGARDRFNGMNTGSWQGRLSLRVHSVPAQVVTAHFELQGNPQTGNLRLTTPLGTVLAAMQWDKDTATFQNGTEIQRFDSLAALVHHATGTDLPVASLFAWLQGDAVPAPGWRVDLSDLPSGRLNAQRLEPETPAELKIILDP